MSSHQSNRGYDDREVKAFEKVGLEPGESTTVTFTLRERDVSRWSRRSHEWVLETALFEFAVGASSRDLRVRVSVEIVEPSRILPLDRSGTVAEWMAHRTGQPLLLEALRDTPSGDLVALLADDETLRMIGSFPLTRVATMMSDLLGTGFVDTLLARQP